MERTIEDMLRLGMMIVSETEGYYHVTWLPGIDMVEEEEKM